MKKRERVADCADQERCAVAKKTSIGGQALMEGIMMRGPERTAMAVRTPEGEIAFEEWENPKSKCPILKKIPILRGVINFAVSMKDGYKCLMRSAELSGLDAAEEEYQREKEAKKAEKAAKKAEKRRAKGLPEKKKEKKVKEGEEEAEETQEKKESGLMLALMLIAVPLSVILVIGLFIALPTFLFSWLSTWIPALKPDNLALASLIKSLFEGVFKIIILVSYMALVSLMKDIRRTFQYHGAEHKTIFCYEHGMELTVENVRKERRCHPRCGTSFLILMVLVSMFVGFFIDPISIWITGKILPDVIRAIVRILLIPLIMGIGYEVLKYAGRHDNLFIRIVSAPGLWLQRITVLEPDDGMIECAIRAFVAVLPENERPKELSVEENTADAQISDDAASAEDATT